MTAAVRFNRAAFQARVDALMRAGMLFGSAVRLARRERHAGPEKVELVRANRARPKERSRQQWLRRRAS